MQPKLAKKHTGNYRRKGETRGCLSRLLYCQVELLSVKTACQLKILWLFVLLSQTLKVDKEVPNYVLQ